MKTDIYFTLLAATNEKDVLAFLKLLKTGISLEIAIISFRSVLVIYYCNYSTLSHKYDVANSNRTLSADGTVFLRN